MDPQYRIGDVVKIIGSLGHGKVGRIGKVLEPDYMNRPYYLVNDVTVPEHWLELIQRPSDMITEAMDKVYKNRGIRE